MRTLSGIAILLCSVSWAADSRIDETGRVDRLSVAPGWVRVGTDVRLYQKGWGNSKSLSGANDRRLTVANDVKTSTATLSVPSGAAVRIEQVVREEGGKLVLDLTATGLRDGAIECIALNVSFPADAFAKGLLTTPAKSVELPEKLPDPIYLWSGKGSPLIFADGRRKAQVRLEIEPAVHVTVQDGRKWEQEFTAMVHLHSGNLPAGQSIKSRVTLSASGEMDQRPAQAAIDPSVVRYKLTGIGGNYCFSIESPVAKHTLENLAVAAARTEMSLTLWAPKKLGDAGDDRDYKPYAAADRPDSRLRREMEMMRLFTQKKVQFTTSIWRMPLWMVTSLGDNPRRPRVRITAEQWPQVCRAIGTYLLYAKDKYQAEPDYFSFNESDIGVDVLLKPEEHREAIKILGAHFAKLGLKTRLLLGDTAGPRNTAFCQPTANDPEAMKYVGAVSFHSWNGARPEQYAAWGDLAERVKRPLICAEAGVDPAAWQGGKYKSFSYAVREMALYQELLLHARPQSIVYWEFTGDYSLLASDRSPQSTLTERFALQKHWCDLTPPGSEALAVQCDNPAVLVTAFRAAGACTIHIANINWERPITLTGLPPDLKSLQLVRTAKDQLFAKLETVPVKDGKLTLVLPTESLTSLTTMKVGELKAVEIAR